MKRYLIMCYNENVFLGLLYGTLDELKLKIKKYKITNLCPKFEHIEKLQR